MKKPVTDLSGSGQRWDCHVHVFEADAPTLPGHYAPADAPLEAIEARAAQCGIERLVLVQPSVYGSDNSVMERALRRSSRRHRGIAVLAASTDDAELDRLHDAGVRGVRFNLVSPVGNDASGLLELAPRLRERNLHVQWYAQPPSLPRIADLQEATGLTFVLDHLAGLRAEPSAAADAWPALARLARAGAWIKLSGWYRLGATAPYLEMVPLIRRIAELFGSHLVWGSDWPHTALPASDDSRLRSLLNPVETALGRDRLDQCLTRSPIALYA